MAAESQFRKSRIRTRNEGLPGNHSHEREKRARGNLRRKRGQLIDAPCSLPWAGLAGELAEHQRHMLARVAADEADIAALDQQIADRLAPHAAQMAQLMTVPGIDWVFAATIIAEIGLDMSVFPSAGHLAVWTGACPRQQPERRPAQTGRRRTRNPSLKTALCNAAIAASRKRGSFFKVKYHKLKSRRGGYPPLCPPSPRTRFLCPSPAPLQTSTRRP